MIHSASRTGPGHGRAIGYMEPAAAPPPAAAKTPKFARPDEDDYDPHWRDRAACLDEDPEIWFPVGDTGPALLQIEDAKAICRRCPAVTSCGQWAMQAGPAAFYGIFGGMTAEERRAIKRRRSREERAAA